jgi:hypothetical protein
LIDETKDAFTTQQEEINALHRAQERAEARVSEIHEGLKESEEELRVLERELQDIDTLDRELHELTHEKSMLEAKVNDAEDKHAAMQAVSILIPHFLNDFFFLTPNFPLFFVSHFRRFRMVILVAQLMVQGVPEVDQNLMPLLEERQPKN